MKLKNEFIFHDVGENTMLVSTNESKDSFHGMIKINATGKFICTQLQNDVSEDDIVKAILEEYETDEATARNAVKEFVNKLREVNAIID